MACVGDFQEMEAATIPALTQAHAAGRRAGLEEAAQDGEARMTERGLMPVMLDHIDWCRSKAKEGA